MYILFLLAHDKTDFRQETTIAFFKGNIQLW